MALQYDHHLWQYSNYCKFCNICSSFGIHYFRNSLQGFGVSFLITYVGIIGLIIFSNNYANGKVFGDLLCMVAALFYAIYLLIISKLGKETSLNIIFTTFFCCLFSLIPMMIDSRPYVPATNFEWINLLLMALPYLVANS